MNSGLLLLIIFIVLVAFRVPVAFSMLLSAFVYLLTTKAMPPSFIAQGLISGSASYTFLAIPVFMLVGELMNSAGITRRIFYFADTLVGHITGGLGHVNVVSSVLFAGVSGSAVADAAGLGKIEIKSMTDNGYDSEFAVGVTAASSTIGPIFPPSSPMVIYGIISGTSIGHLFLGGATIGIIMALFIMTMVYIISRKRNYPKNDRFDIRKSGKAFFTSIWALFTPIILLFGLLTGKASPTEVATLAVLYSMFLGFVIYKELTWKKLYNIMVKSMEDIGMVLLLLTAGKVFAWALGAEKIADVAASWLFSISDNKIIILILLNLFLLFIGTFMETNAALLITIPILLPIANAVGLTNIQFGVIMVLNLMIGLLTPPMAIVLFITSKISKISLEKAFKATAPYYIALIFVLMLINIYPVLISWLPDLIYK